ncbi:MAG: caa(3)-type oxidase subunit IV [Pseudoalteromonas tetraodonis]|mgnify:CR=1 FL=1|jgi:caa(3)-type oxidase subunit IV
MGETPEEIQKHVKTYIIVGATLIACSFLTVGITFVTTSVVIGLAIACFKSGLVAVIFMHLNHEKPIIYKILLFTFFFFLGLMILTLMALYDPVHMRNFNG